MTEREPQPAVMPKWVPVLIGALLVGMAALAVYTGIRNRDNDTLLGHVKPKSSGPRTNAPAPGGEPVAGGSLVLQENVPEANAAVQGQSRAVISGGPGGVSSVVRIWARRGMILEVQPANTMVYVNDIPIGEASQFNTMDEAYEFAAAGSYNVKLVGPNGAEKAYIVTASDDAPNDVARIAARF
jgi:hypothetical protein